MPYDRFYIDAPLRGEMSLEGEELHHLTRVMRKEEGEEIELINGRHTLARAKIEQIKRSSARLTVISWQEKLPLLPPLTLAQAFLRPTNLELVIQKGTELGVSTFSLYPAEQSDRKEYSDKQKKRLEKIIIGAVKQCGRLDLPFIKWEKPLWEDMTYFGDVSPHALPITAVKKLPATLAIGPEKGWSQSEVAALEEVGQGISFGPYTLRAETAAIAGLSLLVAGNSY